MGTPATTTAGETLKRCPFCGGPVELEEVAPTYDRELYGKRRWWGIKCRNATNRGGTCALQIVPQASVEAATERWNTRAPSPALSLAQEALLDVARDLESVAATFEADDEPEAADRIKRIVARVCAAIDSHRERI